MIEKINNKLLSVNAINIWIVSAIFLPYFSVPIFLLYPDIALAVVASTFFSFGSVWWIWIMLYVKRNLSAIEQIK